MTTDLRDGACRQLPYAELDRLFFEPRNGDDNVRAKALCTGCQVREACFDLASAERIPHGTFGGETAKARRLRLNIRPFEYAA